jgi:preprotein translocase subunit SecA
MQDLLTTADNETLQKIFNLGKNRAGSIPKERLDYWANRIKNTIPGQRFFLSLFNLAAFQHASDQNPGEKTLEFLIAIAELTIELQDPAKVAPFIEQYKKGELSLKQVYCAIEKVKLQLNRDKYPEEKLDKVIAAFRSTGVKNVDQLTIDYKAIVKLADDNDFANASTETLKAQLETLRADLQLANPDKQNILRFIAITRETIKRQFGIFPYNTQIITLLALLDNPAELKGRIAQMNTGEGKSTVIAMLSALLAFQGKQVDIITSAGSLAQRDQAKYADFYDFFGLTSSAVPDDQHVTPQDFKAQIVYGTNTDFEFALLRDYLDGTKYLAGRKFDCVIVDELDNLFIDLAGNSARISIPDPQPKKWLYPIIYGFIVTNCPAQYPREVPDRWIEEIRNILASHQQGKYAEYVATIEDIEISNWIQSAIEARFMLEEDWHYHIKPVRKVVADEETFEDDIVIVDWENTGVLAEGCRWPHTHQFLEEKHGLAIEDPSLTGASISHPVFFALYDKIFGLTGTIGSPEERAEIREIYQTDSFDVPPHRIPRREPLDHSYTDTKNEQHAAILEDIKTRQTEKRSSLILVKNIKESEQLAKYLRDRGISLQLHNGLQSPAESALIIDQAGEPGMVTIATNTAGRGTDIVLSADTIASGGLHVIFGFYPKNTRVEQQGFGRAGRQGQPGTCRMIVCEEDEHAKARAPERDPFEFLQEQREQELKVLSKSRCIKARVERLNQKYIMQFVNKLRAWRITTDDDALKSIQATLDTLEDSDASSAETDTLSEYEKQLRQTFISQMHTHAHSGRSSSDWLSWLKLYRDHLNKTIKTTWAKFFTKIDLIFQEVDNPAGTFEFAKYEAILQTRFATVMQDLDIYLEDSQNAFRRELIKLIGVDVFAKRPAYSTEDETRNPFYAMHTHLIDKKSRNSEKYGKDLTSFSRLCSLISTSASEETLSRHAQQYEPRLFETGKYRPLRKRITDLSPLARQRACEEYMGHLRGLSARYKTFIPPSDKPDLLTELEICLQVLDEPDSPSQQARP